MINLVLLFGNGIGFSEVILLGLLYPVILVLIALAIRRPLLWYLKINTREDLLKQQNILLKSIYDKLAERDESKGKSL